MFRALLCPSSGAHNYDVDYHIGRYILGFLYVGDWLRVCWSGVRVAYKNYNKIISGIQLVFILQLSQ